MKSPGSRTLASYPSSGGAAAGRGAAEARLGAARLRRGPWRGARPGLCWIMIVAISIRMIHSHTVILMILIVENAYNNKHDHNPVLLCTATTEPPLAADGLGDPCAPFASSALVEIGLRARRASGRRCVDRGGVEGGHGKAGWVSPGESRPALSGRHIQQTSTRSLRTLGRPIRAVRNTIRNTGLMDSGSPLSGGHPSLEGESRLGSSPSKFP